MIRFQLQTMTTIVGLQYMRRQGAKVRQYPETLTGSALHHKLQRLFRIMGDDDRENIHRTQLNRLLRTDTLPQCMFRPAHFTRGAEG